MARPDDRPAASAQDEAVLLWIPVGAGGHVVRRTSAWWERLVAWRQRRDPAPLFHAALELRRGGVPLAVEMAPAWGAPHGDRGDVRTGPVGLRALGRSRYFRYEVRCWAGGRIPDRAWAVGAPDVVTCSPRDVDLLARRVAEVPALVWGRAPSGTRDLWTSNSVVSWLLATTGLLAGHAPPCDGRAPGWEAGVVLAGDGWGGPTPDRVE